MALWQWGLLLLAVVWALQSYGVWLQMRHYSDVFKGITQKYADGFVGTGAFHGRFLKRGAIAIVVVSPDLAVRRILTMSGRSVFAKFKRHEQFEGMALDQLRAEPALFGEKQPGLTAAITQAVAQIDRTRAGEEPPLRESLAASKA
ncbi:transcriptional regulator GutM [Nitratireductor sp. GZWM139]|uniref:transcriptional regulator GutM n=1 Tax=Nitratireductor sp. GZWM139 TaxID=2950541 RepID=UPI0024BE5F2B|nr:transcriptional regulator GutM [Nitratireductor sp. GZWM139]MDJ1464315.1 transcriptional regulator [Nitratireductor sp. GZWM139]